MAQMVKRLPAMWETWVRFLGWEDSPGEGNGNPLQLLPRGAWWVIAHGVAESDATSPPLTLED